MDARFPGSQEVPSPSLFRRRATVATVALLVLHAGHIATERARAPIEGLLRTVAAHLRPGLAADGTGAPTRLATLAAPGSRLRIEVTLTRSRRP
jgi:hypothetical protein